MTPQIVVVGAAGRTIMRLNASMMKQTYSDTGPGRHEGHTRQLNRR